METILKHFKNLTSQQISQFEALMPLYRDWNSKINVISRKDIDNLYVHHVLHSLAIARMVQFTDGTRIADIGTGGGFPGIPLAIMFPQCSFTLIDSIGKKIMVASAVADALGLNNVVCRHERAEDEKGKYDFIVSRGVMPLPDLYAHAARLVDRKSQHNAFPNGVICLKGGDLSNELVQFRHQSETVDITDWFDIDYFDGKKVVYVQI